MELASGWNHNDLTHATGAPKAAGDPAGYTWDVDSTQHVVYRGTDGHIHELGFSLASGWNHNDLTHATGAPKAAGDPAGYTWDVDSTQHVVYRGTDGHIHELGFSLASGWNHNDLTHATGAPGAAGDPAGYTWDVDSTQHVVYSGTDGHIHELGFSLASGWNHNDLTHATGAPGAAGGPAGYTWDVDSTQHVVYSGTDGHIHELGFSLVSGWNHNDLTHATGAPGGAGSPAGYTWDVNSTQHVVYSGRGRTEFEKRDIHELWFSLASGWHHNDHTTDIVNGLPGSAPAGYTWDVDSTQHVVYRDGVFSGIADVWFNLASGWHREELAWGLAGHVFFPIAAGNPVGYTWDVDRTAHVVYLGGLSAEGGVISDGHIHELWSSLPIVIVTPSPDISAATALLLLS